MNAGKILPILRPSCLELSHKLEGGQSYYMKMLAQKMPIHCAINIRDSFVIKPYMREPVVALPVSLSQHYEISDPLDLVSIISTHLAQLV